MEDESDRAVRLEAHGDDAEEATESLRRRHSVGRYRRAPHQSLDDDAPRPRRPAARASASRRSPCSVSS